MKNDTPQEFHADEAQRALDQMDEFMVFLQQEIEKEGKKLQQMKDNRQRWREDHTTPPSFVEIRDIPAYIQAHNNSYIRLETHPEKGRILKANKSFDEGEVLFVEDAVVFASDKAYAQLKDELDVLFEAWIVVHAMGQADVQLEEVIFDLANVHEDRNTDVASIVEALRERGIVADERRSALEVAQLMGICQTNAFEFIEGEDTKRGLFPLSAMLSHSCVPNAVYAFEGETLFMHALAPIEAGDEITSSYIKQHMTVEDRQKELLSRYGFVCRCEACLKEKEE